MGGMSAGTASALASRRLHGDHPRSGTPMSGTQERIVYQALGKLSGISEPAREDEICHRNLSPNGPDIQPNEPMTHGGGSPLTTVFTTKHRVGRVAVRQTDPDSV